MKGLTPSQLETLAEQISQFAGAHLQKIHASDRDVVLGFWTKEGLKWLWVDMKVSEPYLALLDELPPQDLKKKPPVLNFLRAHGEGLPLVKVEFLSEFGRVLRLSLSAGGSFVDIEIRLIPHAPNFIVSLRDNTGSSQKAKSVSWNVVKELSSFTREPTTHLADEDLVASVIDWMRRFKKESAKALTAEEIESRYQKELQKKEKVLAKIDEEIANKQDPTWRRLGDWLKAEQSLDVPKQWASLVEPTKGLAFNIEKAFRRAKENDQKLQGTQERRQEVSQELSDLRKLTAAQWFERNRKKSEKSFAQNRGRNIKADFKARSLELSDEVKVYFGKSGADNLKLLRQARAWDFWVHLKDEPGSHGVVFRPKNRDINSADFRKIATKLVEYSLGEKAKARVGDRFQMLICEVRHVNPIKGDRLGRVNYREEKVMGFVYQA